MNPNYIILISRMTPLLFFNCKCICFIPISQDLTYIQGVS